MSRSLFDSLCIVLILALAPIAASGVPCKRHGPSVAEAKTAIMPFYTEVLTAAPGTNATTITEYINSTFTEDFRSIQTSGLNTTAALDRADFLASFIGLRYVLPDTTWLPQQIIVSHNKTETIVVVRSHGSGHPVGSFLGVGNLTGAKPIKVDTIDILETKCVGGKVQVFRANHLEGWLVAVQELTA